MSLDATLKEHEKIANDKSKMEGATLYMATGHDTCKQPNCDQEEPKSQVASQILPKTLLAGQKKYLWRVEMQLT